MAAAAGLVDKATSDLLIGPDWAMNLDICDIINGDPGQARDVIKAVKKRLGSKNPKVQLLALTVLETLIKNCTDVVHQQVAERDVLHEMVKIVKKKTDMQVRDKILVLVDAWQEAFGGPGGRYPQYYMAYEELRRFGIEFPQRAAEAAVPIFTPPQTQPITAYNPQGYGSQRVEAARQATSETTMNLSDIETARGGVDLLSEMLNAIEPPSKEAVKEEVIVELLEQCRVSQRRVEHLVSTTSDEELLRRGLALNDDLQRVIAKHDALASGSPLPRDSSNATAPPAPHGRQFDHEEEEAEDDFQQLAHRPSRFRSQSQASEPSKASPQLALPPPPPPRKLSTTPSQREMTVDLLSGDAYQDTQPQTVQPQPVVNPNYVHTPLGSSQPSSTALVPLSSGQQQSVNPFATAPFQAVPQAEAVPQPQAGVYGSSPPQQQYSYSNGGVVGQVPQPKYTYAQYQQQQQAQQTLQHYQGATGQLPSAGYAAPWSSPLSPPSGYSSETAWSGAPQALNQQQAQQPMNQQQRALLYGKSLVPNNVLSPIPPPPGQHSLRQQFFQQQQQQQQSTLNSDPYQRSSSFTQVADITSRTHSMSLQDGLGVQGPPTQQPAGQDKPTDKLFEDLVDFRSVNAKLKSAGVSGSLSRPNT